MQYIVFLKDKKVIPCEDGSADSKNIYHVKRNMIKTELMIMLEGTLHIKHLEEYVLEKNDVFFLPQNILHYGTEKSTFKILWFHIILPSDFKIIEENQINDFNAHEYFILPIKMKIHDITNILTLGYQLLQYPLTDETIEIRTSLLNSLLLSIQYQATEHNSKKVISHSRLNSIVNYIDSCIWGEVNKELTIKNLSIQFNYNEKYIFNLFKKNLGITPLQYIIRQRMNIAKTLLLTTSNTIEAIAISVGYDNPQYFMRLFKQTLNITPSEFRKAYSHSLELYLSK